MEVLVSHDLSLDETALKVTVDNTSCLWSLCSALDGPAADLLLSGGEVVLQTELVETFVSDLSEAALDLDIGHEGVECGLVVTEGPELLFELNGEGNDICTLATVGLDPLCDLGQVFALLAEVVFHGKVDEVDDWLGGDKAQLLIVSIIFKCYESRTNLLVNQLNFRSRPLSISDRLILLQEL